jgi:hypothetical protein
MCKACLMSGIARMVRMSSSINGRLAMDKITLTNDHGTFTTTGLGLDLVISAHLPASPNGLREVLADRCPDLDYSDIHSAAEALVMIADMDYPATPALTEREFEQEYGIGHDEDGLPVYAVDPSIRAAVGQRQSDMALGIDRQAGE